MPFFDIPCGKKQENKQPMTGNGNHRTYKNGDLRDGLFLLYPHDVFLSSPRYQWLSMVILLVFNHGFSLVVMLGHN